MQAKLMLARTALESGHYDVAVELLDELVIDGHLEATYLRSQIELKDISNAELLENRLKLLKSCADRGHANALFDLYVHYDTGDGVHQNQQLAHEYLVKAEEANHPSAKWLVGQQLLYGTGLSGVDIPRGIRLIVEAVELKSKGAMLTLAGFYESGEFGQPIDPKQAQQLRSDAASSNVIEI